MSRPILKYSQREACMAKLPQPSEGSRGWSPEALALAAQAKVLSGNKLEQLVVRFSVTAGALANVLALRDSARDQRESGPSALDGRRVEWVREETREAVCRGDREES